MIASENTLIESRRQTVQAGIDLGKSAAERNRLGQFATPNPLAIDVARYVDSLIEPKHGSIRFADPAIGSGSFFSAALSVFGSKRIGSAIGIELDPVFADAARHLWADAGLKVVSADFTHLVGNGSCPPSPNVILANPPYVRHHHLGRLDKTRLQQLTLRMTGVEVSGLAGLYVHFLLLATAWMEEDGIAAWLIPSEFMDVNYGGALKAFLVDHVTLIRAHRFDPLDVQFDDALVSSAVLVFRKSRPLTGHLPQFTYGGSLALPRAAELVPRDQLRDCRKWSQFPRHAQSNRQTCDDVAGPRLGDFFRIQRGVVTGCNAFFVLDRAVAAKLGLPEQYLRPILPSPRHLESLCIDGAQDGYPLLDRQLCLIDCDLPESLVEARHPALWQYLQTAQARGIKTGYLISKRSPWYRQEQRTPTPFLCTYMGRGTDGKPPFRFIWNRSNAIGTNLYLMLTPQAGLAAMLRDKPDRAGIVHTLLSDVTGDELRGEGRVYGGGLNKIEPSELARISAKPFVRRWPEIEVDVQTQGELFARP